jgi:hypothetical protein
MTYRRAGLSALAGGGAFPDDAGSSLDSKLELLLRSPPDSASNFPSAARNGSSRGAWGNRSSSMAHAARGFTDLVTRA